MLVGRQQFYIDHEWFLRLGEALPSYQPPVPEDDRKYLLYWSRRTAAGRSTRPATTGTCCGCRGVPIVYIHPDDEGPRHRRRRLGADLQPDRGDGAPWPGSAGREGGSPDDVPRLEQFGFAEGAGRV
ncbi:MAG: hypothetical protein U0797_03280 [Gemmataceae bacterium]